MNETMCPAATLLSLHLDGELEAAGPPPLSACCRCRSLARELREVDDLLRRAPARDLARVDLARLLTARRSALPRAVALVLGLLALAAAGAGGTIAGQQL